MRDVLLLAAALVVNICGMAWLALGMTVHWNQARAHLTSSVRAPVRVLRTMGAAALAASLLLCMSADHASIAVLVWTMSLAAASLAVAFTLTWRAQWLAWLVPWVRESGD